MTRAMYHRYRALGVEGTPLRCLSAWYDRLMRRPAYEAHVMLPLS